MAKWDIQKLNIKLDTLLLNYISWKVAAWYYGENFDANSNPVKTFIDLDISGYDQIPSGSYDGKNAQNFSSTVQFCNSKIANSRLDGFL